jgi:hypothetical protein
MSSFARLYNGPGTAERSGSYPLHRMEPWLPGEAWGGAGGVLAVPHYRSRAALKRLTILNSAEVATSGYASIGM